MKAMIRRLLARRRHCTGQFLAVSAVIGIVSVTFFLRTAYATEPAAVINLVDELKFKPAIVVVKEGETVQWQNVSVLVHTVTDDPGLVAKDMDYELPEGAKPFNSGNIEPNGIFEHTFTVPGTYKYFCIPHEAAGMIAKVVVTK